MKVKNLRRDPRVSLCLLNRSFFGEWGQVEGTAEIVERPAALRRCSSTTTAGSPASTRTGTTTAPPWSASSGCWCASRSSAPDRPSKVDECVPPAGDPPSWWRSERQDQDVAPLLPRRRRCLSHRPQMIVCDLVHRTRRAEPGVSGTDVANDHSRGGTVGRLADGGPPPPASAVLAALTRASDGGTGRQPTQNAGRAAPRGVRPGRASWSGTSRRAGSRSGAASRCTATPA